MKHNVQAVILAAGRGSRLGPFTKECHKALLPIGRDPSRQGEETCFLRRQIEVLQQLGVDDIVVVVGYKRQQIVDALTRWGLEAVRVVVNPTTESGASGSLHSLQYAVTAGLGVLSTERDTLVMDADIVYHRDVLERLLRANGSTTLVCDQYDPGPEPVLVFGSVAKPRFIGKGLVPALVDDAPCLGEATGIIKLAPSDHPFARAMMDWMLGDPTAPEATLERRGFGPARKATEHEELTDRLMRHGRMHALVFSGKDLPFVEVDTVSDYEDLRARVYPAILRAEAVRE